MRPKKRTSRPGTHWTVRPRAACRIRAGARVGILATPMRSHRLVPAACVKVARDNAVDSELAVTATADLELPRSKTIRDLTLTTNLRWHPRTADLRAKKFLENSFTKLEASMRDFSARYHATASSATTAKVVQSKTAIDTLTQRPSSPTIEATSSRNLWAVAPVV